MTKLILALALLATPSVALAGHGRKSSSSSAQRNADAARKSSANHAARGNSSASKNMAKIAEQRQRAADRAKRKK